jgi:hypothetical protein
MAEMRKWQKIAMQEPAEAIMADGWQPEPLHAFFHLSVLA